jgi:tetratricopeptide (TPR) repeat protein
LAVDNIVSRFLVVWLVLGGGVFFATPSFGSQAMTYRSCMDQVAANPVSGYEAALRWRESDGGPAAMHCMALALSGQGEYAQAAQTLEDAARLMESRAGGGEQVPQLLGQAGNAWLLAGDGARAFDVFDEALGNRGLSMALRVELLVDRSRSHAIQHDYAQVIEDLNAAMNLVGSRSDMLAYRASAYRHLEQIEPAQEDIEQALKLGPDNPDALYERGNLKFALGDIEDAHADWNRVIALAPHSAAAESAKQNLAELDAAVKRASTTPPTPVDPTPEPGASDE